MYAESMSASRALTVTAGRVKGWTMSASIRRSRGEMETSPLPPAFFTATPYDGSTPKSRAHMTILPLILSDPRSLEQLLGSRRIISVRLVLWA